ncbi:SRPBCC family protein [Cellulomonas hominis]|uniref:SRPBCC family protein n=1 Tax=Cellulomonas hominis TaxID=156981 RepID=UPI001B8EF0CC|nr:SRPBCC domain-containing protein [Cellulomonas hominis]VTR78522.1 hypothetical protein CHMI_03304 [Cellulomonas hominis]
MVDILHRVGVRASAHDVYAALTTSEGVAGWWTAGTESEAGPGGRITLRFDAAPEPYVLDVADAEPCTHVRWRVLEGPPEWVGTSVDFRLGGGDGQTVVLFRHEGWAEPVEFMHHCSTKWATFLLSLRELVETGAGRPAPHDLKIDDWN